MATIRSKLTLAYAGALIGSVAAFSIALYAARRASVARDVARSVAVQADLAARALHFAASANEPITTIADSLVGVVITPRVARVLDAFPDYVFLLDKDSRALYVSPAVRALQAQANAPDQARRDIEANRESDFDRLFREAIGLAPGGAYQITLRDRELILVARQLTDVRGGVSRIVAGRDVDLGGGWPREFLTTLLIVAPLIIGASIGGAYLIAGRAVEPVGRMINEVEAITDGRSLHRRLPIEATGDELARLGATLNAMIARLEGSFAALRRFTADASHELKTPLAVLRADVERAMHAPSGSTEQLVALEEALQETARMADLVDSLLTLARADEGRFDLHREPFAVAPLVHEVLETAVILGEDAGLQVSLPVVEDAVVMGDRMRLRQLFLNLVTNAIKYTSRGGSVELALRRRDADVLFSVRDSGIGIAAADLPYIFERFWRADRARSRLSERGGFGLGLAISQWIAQAHGGTLTVQSRLHRGSVFTVSLPVAGPSPETGAESVAQSALPEPPNPVPTPTEQTVAD